MMIAAKYITIGIAALALGGAASVALVSDVESQAVDDRTVFCTEFVPNLEASDTYDRFTKSAKLDTQRWEAYRTAICAGESPLDPAMATLFGKALAAAGKMALPEVQPPPTTTTTTEPPATFTLFAEPGASVVAITDGFRATIPGAADASDTAYAQKDMGAQSGRVFTRSLIGLANGQALDANLAVLQVRDSANALVYELYLTPGRVLNLWSPAGGLRATSINESTGVVVPNNGTKIRAEVSALKNDSVIVRVDGVDKITLTGLTSATTGDQQFLRVGIDHFDGASPTTVSIDHTFVANGADWLGSPGGEPPPPPPPPPTGAFAFPRSFHIWGGPIQTIMTTHDVVVTLDSKPDPASARAVNPGLLVFSNGDVAHEACPDYRTFSITYGGGLVGSTVECGTFTPWPGVNDTLQPNPQGTIRGFLNSDYGCKQADGLLGFGIYKPDTASWMKQAYFYGWKKYDLAARGYNGVWSDNVILSDFIYAGWFYGWSGSGCSLATGPSIAEWDTGMKSIADGIRSLSNGQALVGGNGCASTTTKPEMRAAFDACLVETLETYLANGPGAYPGYGGLLDYLNGWNATDTGRARVLACMDLGAASTDPARMRFGLAAATIAGCAYMPYMGSHSDYYLPAEMKLNGQRHYLGKPTGVPTRSGNIWSRTFEHGTVSANFDTRTGTFTVN
jgi:hypothetical protein